MGGQRAAKSHAAAVTTTHGHAREARKRSGFLAGVIGVEGGILAGPGGINEGTGRGGGVFVKRRRPA